MKQWQRRDGSAVTGEGLQAANNKRYGGLKVLTGKVQHHWFWPVGLIFLLSRIALWLVGYIASHSTIHNNIYNWSESFHTRPLATTLPDIWARWDSEWILSVVTGGYHTMPISDGSLQHGLANWGFFPLYPLLVRLLAGIIGEPVLAGIVV